MSVRIKAASLAVLLFFAVLTGIGLASVGDYGVPCDQPAELKILQRNLCEYAVHFCGKDSEPVRWYASRNIYPISQNVERDHGLAPYYAFAPFMMAYLDSPRELMLSWQVYTWLWFMIGCAALYGFCRETGLSRFVSCMGVLLLCLCPRFFAEGHYNNKDMVLLSLVLCVLWLGVRFLKQPGFLRGALLSVAGALSANVKVTGAFPWALIGLGAIVWVTANKRWSLRMGLIALWTVLVFAAVYAAVTPACWPDVGGYLRYLVEGSLHFNRWTGVVLYQDVVFDQTVTRLPRSYLVWMIVTTLPLYVLPLSMTGSAWALVRAVRQKTKAFGDAVSLSLLIAGLCWTVPLLLAVLLRPTVYNGWRHFYFVYAGLAVLGAHGISACVHLARKYGGDCGMHGVFLAGLLLFFGWTGAAMLKNHPYEYAYYNRLGHTAAMEQSVELDYWTVGTLNAMERLTEAERNTSLPLELGTRDEMSRYGVVHNYPALPADCLEKLTIVDDPDAPYLFYNTTYARIYGTDEPKGYHELLRLESYGTPFAVIYEKDVR